MGVTYIYGGLTINKELSLLQVIVMKIDWRRMKTKALEFVIAFYMQISLSNNESSSDYPTRSDSSTSGVLVLKQKSQHYPHWFIRCLHHIQVSNIQHNTHSVHVFQNLFRLFSYVCI